MGRRGRYRWHRKKSQAEKIKQFDSFGVCRLTESLAWSIIDDTTEIVDYTPAKSLDLIELRRKRLKALGSSFDQSVMRRCLEVALLGLSATAKRSLGRLKEALGDLREAALISVGCKKCQAEVSRLFCIIFCYLGDTQAAAQFALDAIERYKKIPGNGHNRSGNASASCLFSYSYVDRVKGDLDTAILKTKKVIESIDHKVSQNLFLYAHLAFATDLVRRGNEDDLGEADRLLDKAAISLRRTKPSIPAAKIDWIRGMVKGRMGNKRAEYLLSSARDQLVELGLLHEVLMVTADLARFYLIEGNDSNWLIESCFSEIKDLIPKYAKGIYLEVMGHIASDSPKKLFDSLLSLRRCQKEGGASGDALMPCLLPDVVFVE